jgi:hypothetical protein
MSILSILLSIEPGCHMHPFPFSSSASLSFLHHLLNGLV